MRGRLPPGRAPGKEDTVNVHLNGDAWAVLGWLAAVLVIITISMTRKGHKK